MGRGRILAIVVGVALAVACLPASSAGAYPVFATSAAGGNTGFAIKTLTLQTASGRRITCTSYESAYAIESQIELRLTAYGYACTSKKAPCSSQFPTSMPEGQIELGLYGFLFYINKERHRVGLSFTPREQHRLVVYCRGIGYDTIEGHVIASISPVNRLVEPPAAFSLRFAQKEGVQQPVGFEESGLQTLMSRLEAEEPEKVGLGFSTPLRFNLPVEIAG